MTIVQISASTIKRFILLIVLVFVTVKSYSQPPDTPLQPQQWVSDMGLGHWWIFRISPESDNGIKVDNYSPKILDSLQELGFTGGRLHWNVASTTNKTDEEENGAAPIFDFFDANGDILQGSIDYVETIVDDMLARDMAICLNIQFQTPHEAKNKMTEVKSRMFKNWKKLSQTFKDKSHNFAMCPVIEFHGWENIGIPRSQQQDSLNVLYDSLTRIFREDNPTRIMSFKPWGASKRGEANTLAFPFGDDPAPSDLQQFYYVASFSGSAGMGAWDTWTPTMPQADLDALHFTTINAGGDASKLWGLRAMLEHRTNTGIPFWMDHWRPNYHKNANDPAEQWSMDQNIAYSEFWIDKLKEVGSAGAMFQTRTFWNDQTDDFIRQTGSSSNEDIMSVMFIDMLRERVLNIEDYKGVKVSFHPNPINDLLYIDQDDLTVEDIKIYNYLAQEVTDKVSLKNRETNKFIINCVSLSSGLYIVRVRNKTIKFIKN